MIGLLPVLVLLGFSFLIYDCYTHKPVKSSFFNKFETFLVLLFFYSMLTILVYISIFCLFIMVDKNDVKKVHMGGWNIKTAKLVDETHKGSKSNVYITNNVHITADMNDGTYKVISLPTSMCSFKYSNNATRAEMYNIVESNKYYTFITGLDRLKSKSVYVIEIPHNTEIKY